MSELAERDRAFVSHFMRQQSVDAGYARMSRTTRGRPIGQGDVTRIVAELRDWELRDRATGEVVPLYRHPAPASADRERSAGATEDRRFPVQGESFSSYDGERMVYVPRSKVPWSVAEAAYAVYAAKYGTGQSLETLAQRGGFGRGELLWLLDGGTNDKLCTKVAAAPAQPAGGEAV
jgi:hypothetical protein